jgi:hypothetical protein
MKLLIGILLLLLIFPGYSPAQIQDMVDIFGYFETQIMATQLNDNLYQLFSNKLRLDLRSDINENVTFAANVNFITYHGKKEWHILDFLPGRISTSVPEEFYPVFTLKFEDEIFLDNAYLKLRFKLFDLTIGRQQISTGTGYVWNPTDVFNIKDLFDPTYEQPGHNAIMLEVPIGYDYTLSALYAPESDWNSSTKMIRLKGRALHFDYTLIAVEREWTFHDYTTFDSNNGGFLGIPQKRHLFGISTAGEIIGLGVLAEYAYNEMQYRKNFQEWVAGVNYTFDFQTYFMVEYYHNSLGKEKPSHYTFNDWMRLFTNEQKTIAKDQTYVLVQHPLTELLDGGITGIFCLSDKSYVLVPTLIYSLWENVDVMAYFSFNMGNPGTLYAKELGNGGMLRARVYF